MRIEHTPTGQGLRVVRHEIFVVRHQETAYSQFIQPESRSDQWAHHLFQGDGSIAGIVRPNHHFIWGKDVLHGDLLKVFHPTPKDRNSYVSVMAWPITPTLDIFRPRIAITCPTDDFNQLTKDTVRYFVANVGDRSSKVDVNIHVSKINPIFSGRLDTILKGNTILI